MKRQSWAEPTKSEPFYYSGPLPSRSKGLCDNNTEVETDSADIAVKYMGVISKHYLSPGSTAPKMAKTITGTYTYHPPGLKKARS